MSCVTSEWLRHHSLTICVCWRYICKTERLTFGHDHVEDLAFDVRLPILNKSLSRWSAGKEEFWTKMKRATKAGDE